MTTKTTQMVKKEFSKARKRGTMNLDRGATMFGNKPSKTSTASRKTGKKKKGPPVLDVKSYEVDAETKKVRYFIEFQAHEDRVPMSLDASVMLNRTAAWEALIECGFLGTKEDIQNFIDNKEGRVALPRIVTTSVGGWLDGVLATRHGTFGPRGRVSRVEFRSEFKQFKQGEKKGTWREYCGLSKPLLEASCELKIAYLVALMTALASLIGKRKSFSICLTGESSTGKTSAIALSVGLSTFALSDEDLVNFGDTSGYIASALHEFSGQVAGFNDIKSAIEKGGDLASKLQTLTFNNSSASIRRRLTDSRASKSMVTVEGADVRRRNAFTVLFLSAEIRLSELFATGTLQRQGGDIARLIEIPVALAEDGGIFCNVPADKRDAYVKQLEELLKTQYGTIMPRWARFLAKQDVKVLDEKIAAWESGYRGKIVHLQPLHQRIGTNFALIEATARLAEEAGLLPLPLEQFLDGVDNIFERVVGESVNRENDTRQFFLKALRKIVGKNGLPILEKSTEPKKHQDCSLGFRRCEDKRSFVYLSASEFVSSFDEKLQEAARHFVERMKVEGKVAAGKTGKTKPVAQAGLKRRRYLCFRQKYLLRWRDRLRASVTDRL